MTTSASRLFVTFLTFLLASTATAQSKGKSYFLELVLKGGALTDSSVIGAVDAEVLSKVIMSQKAKFKNFKENMLFAKTLKDGDVYHILSYDWTADECKYSYIRIPTVETFVKGDKLTQFKADSNGNIVDSNLSIIDMKYCEKAYSFYSK